MQVRGIDAGALFASVETEKESTTLSFFVSEARLKEVRF